jgi:hypothetical protein
LVEETGVNHRPAASLVTGHQEACCSVNTEWCLVYKDDIFDNGGTHFHNFKEELFILFIPQNQPLFEGVVPCCGENNFEKLLV